MPDIFGLGSVGNFPASRRPTRRARRSHPPFAGLRTNFGDDFDNDEEAPLTEHMRFIGTVGGITTKIRHGSEHFKKAGAKGGAKTAERGVEFYREIGRTGGLVKKKAREDRDRVQEYAGAGDED